MATAAKKPASKPVASSAKKPAGKVAAPDREKTPAVALAKASKTVPAKAGTKEKPVAAQSAAIPEKPKAASPSGASARTAKSIAPVANAEPATEKIVKQAMKTSETKTPTAKSASAKSPAKPAAKSGKKTVAIPHSDAELLAMPEADYMNDAQLAYFKAKLTAMRDEILENARETGEHLKENEVFADPNDRATVEEENLLEQRVRDRERKLLKKINASLARIEAGEYGYCQETGDPIGLPRLLARPTADLSIEAQEKHERLEKLYAD